MAKRVTDQEKELWICNIRDGYTIDDIVTMSGRSKNTICKYTLNQNIPKKQDPLQIESMDEWANYYQDGVDWNDDPYEDMLTSEKIAYKFIESGGCNSIDLWGSEQRRSLAFDMMQYSDKMIADSVGYLKLLPYTNDVKTWSRWLAPVTADWALTEGCETYDMARIYGLTAIACLWFYLYTGTANRPIEQILKNMNEEKNESLRTQLFLATYHYLGARIAAHIKNNTNISKFNVQDFCEKKQAILLGYAYTLCGEHQRSTRLEQVNVRRKVLKIISLFSNNNDSKLSHYVEKGCKTAHKEVVSGEAKFLNRRLESGDNIQKHLYFLIRQNYITINF